MVAILGAVRVAPIELTAPLDRLVEGQKLQGMEHIVMDEDRDWTLGRQHMGRSLDHRAKNEGSVAGKVGEFQGFNVFRRFHSMLFRSESLGRGAFLFAESWAPDLRARVFTVRDPMELIKMVPSRVRAGIRHRDPDQVR